MHSCCYYIDFNHQSWIPFMWYSIHPSQQDDQLIQSWRIKSRSHPSEIYIDLYEETIENDEHKKWIFKWFFDPNRISFTEIVATAFYFYISIESCQTQTTPSTQSQTLGLLAQHQFNLQEIQQQMRDLAWVQTEMTLSEEFERRRGIPSLQISLAQNWVHPTEIFIDEAQVMESERQQEEDEEHLEGPFPQF